METKMAYLVVKDEFPSGVILIEEVQVVQHGWIWEHEIHDFMSEEPAKLSHNLQRSNTSWPYIWLQLLCGNNKLKKCLHKYVRNIRESGYLYTKEDWDCFLTWNVNSCVGSISPLLAFLSASSRFFWSSSSFVTILRLRTLEILFSIFSRFPVSNTIRTAFTTQACFIDNWIRPKLSD